MTDDLTIEYGKLRIAADNLHLAAMRVGLHDADFDAAIEVVRQARLEVFKAASRDVHVRHHGGV